MRTAGRRQCQAISEERLALKLEPVVERLSADVGSAECSGAELVGFFLSLDRWPPGKRVVA